MTKRLLAAVTSSLLVATSVPERATAHVDYVSEGSKEATFGGLVSSILSSPMDLALVLLLGTVGAGGVAFYVRYAKRLTDIQVARSTLKSYRPYLPWMLRLSVGLPLVGAGFSGYLFSPEVAVSARIPQVVIGFLLLFGLATRIMALLGLLMYAGTVVYAFPEALLSVEYVAGFASIIIIGAGQPSADMLLRRIAVTDGTFLSRFEGTFTPGDAVSKAGLSNRFIPPIIRVFVGGGFVYLGVTQKWLAPGPALSVVEKYGLSSLVPISPELWVFGVGLGEVVVGVMLIVGVFTRGAAAAAFGILTLTLFGLPDDPVLAHVTLFGIFSALLVVGGGRYSLDNHLIPDLKERLSPEESEPTVGVD
jgi:uncharacterized membrane protein YphA (DoxX/SURF4 family)